MRCLICNMPAVATRYHYCECGNEIANFALCIECTYEPDLEYHLDRILKKKLANGGKVDLRAELVNKHYQNANLKRKPEAGDLGTK